MYYLARLGGGKDFIFKCKHDSQDPRTFKMIVDSIVNRKFICGYFFNSAIFPGVDDPDQRKYRIIEFGSVNVDEIKSITPIHDTESVESSIPESIKDGDRYF